MAEVLTHRNYAKVAENNLEFIRGDLWDLDVTDSQWPLAVYNPGKEVFKSRLKGVTITMSNGTTKIEKDIFVFHLHQNAGRDPQNGSMQLSFIDKEDQAISFLANDWLNQIGDPDTGFGRHKKELLFGCECSIYNTLLQKIRYYQAVAGVLNTTDIPDSPTEKGGDLSDVSLTIDFEMLYRKIL